MKESDSKPATIGPEPNAAPPYQSRQPTRPPTPEDFIRDLSDSDPLRRFRISPRRKTPLGTGSRTNLLRPME
jgi:hypothetical protein